MLKRVLLPLDDTKSTEVAIKYAFELYRRHRNFISGITIVDQPGIESAMRPMGIGTTGLAKEGEQALLKEEHSKAQELLQKFGRMCDEEGIPHFDRQVFDAPVEILTELSPFFDLIVMGVDACPPYNEDDSLATIRTITRDGHSPILVAPTEYRQIKKVLICYDGSAPSIRATQWFAHLQPFMPKSLHIISLVDPDLFEQRKLEIIRLEEYLRSYGFDPISEIMPEESPIKQIEEFIDETGIDLVVLGPHSGILHDLFFGSLTNHLLERKDLTLFVID